MESRSDGNKRLGFNRFESAQRRQFFHFFSRECAVEDGDAADPASETNGFCAMDDPADSERAACAIVLRRVDAVGIPPGIHAQGDEVAGGFREAAVGLFLQGDFDPGIGKLPELDAFISGFANDF